MTKVDLKTLEATRTVLPLFLKGLKQESLNNLDWTDKALGLVGFGFWTEVDETTPLLNTEVLDGTETLTANATTMTVSVVKGVRAKTQDELDSEFQATVPQVITMRQARLALLGVDSLTTVTDAINAGTDEALKIEWEYATECRRDWESLITMATALGMSELDLDNLFIAGANL